MSKVQLSGNPNEEILSIELVDILFFIHNAKDIYWRIDWIEGVSNNEFDMLTFESKAKKGINLSYNGLLELSKDLIQIYELVLIGDKEEIENSNKNVYDYVIELIDSSYWEVTSSNEVFIKKLCDNLM